MKHTKQYINHQFNVLEAILLGIAERRNTYVKTPETFIYGDMYTFTISEVQNRLKSSLVTILDAVLAKNNLSSFSAFTSHFTAIQCRDLILLYMGAKWYWRDYYNRYTSLESWGNSLVGKMIQLEHTGGIVQSWDYTENNAQYSIQCVIECNSYLYTVVYSMWRSIRDHIRCYQEAYDFNTLIEDKNGLKQYPVQYLMQRHTGRIMPKWTYSTINSIYDANYNDRIVVDATIVDVRENTHNDTGKRIRYILKGGSIVTKHLPPNTYIWH